MATILRDPLVVDNIVEQDLLSPADESLARSNYEAGKLVLLRGVSFDLDYAFLGALDFDVPGPPEVLRKIKKFDGDKVENLDPVSTSPIDQFVFREVFASDAGRLNHYKQQVASGNRQVEALYQRIFPNYRRQRAVYTWRFTRTIYENLHWDNFGIPEIFQQVRIFTNIARSPRLWRTSHSAGDYAETIYERSRLAQFADRLGDDLVRYMNDKVLGGMQAPCLERLPKHHIAFEQGDVWLCETRIVSHQIYHGEKAFATMFFSDPETMDRPELGFDARMRELHRRHHQAAEPAIAG